MIEKAILEEIEAILREPDVDQKLTRTTALCDRRHALHAHSDSADPVTYERPARPGPWTILSADQMLRRPRLTSERGRVLLMHSVAHIEVSAVELALLAVGHFPDAELDYHRDMLRIASEEVDHARLLIGRLREMGAELGEEPVHLDLWEVAKDFRDVVERLAVVPRVLEARGLDVSHNMRRKLRGAGDEKSAAVLDVVYRDEIGHVAIGSKWFRRTCERLGVDAESRFCSIAARFRPGRGDSFIDREGRRRAGFTEREIDFLARSALSP